MGWLLALNVRASRLASKRSIQLPPRLPAVCAANRAQVALVGVGVLARPRRHRCARQRSDIAMAEARAGRTRCRVARQTGGAGDPFFLGRAGVLA